MVAAWMGKGSVMPSRARRSTTTSGRPRAAKPLSAVTAAGPPFPVLRYAVQVSASARAAARRAVPRDGRGAPGRPRGGRARASRVARVGGCAGGPRIRAARCARTDHCGHCAHTDHYGHCAGTDPCAPGARNATTPANGHQTHGAHHARDAHHVPDGHCARNGLHGLHGRCARTDHYGQRARSAPGARAAQADHRRCCECGANRSPRLLAWALGRGGRASSQPWLAPCELGPFGQWSSALSWAPKNSWA